MADIPHNDMVITPIAKQSTPLCILPDARLICYRHGDIVVCDKGREIQSIPLFRSVKERVFGESRLLTRFLRLGIRTAIAIDGSSIVLSIGNMLYELDINSAALSEGFYCGEGIRPLTITSVSGIPGFEDGLYYGEYVHNFYKKPVRVYRRTGKDKWDVVYTFPKDSINHIHNVISDPFRQCLWVFTGDFGEAAAIWKVTNGFKKVERVVSNNQKWRGCVAFAVPEGILFATDAPFIKNHIYLLRENGASSSIANLAGSCIYGCQWMDKYVFSTAVEADGRNETPLRLLFGWKRGAGIQDNYAHMYIGNLKDGFIEVYKEKKDFWPFIFQFGAITFPAGVNNTDMLYFRPSATKNDGTLFTLSL